MDNIIESLIQKFKPITLDEMSSVELMERKNKKYIIDKNILLYILNSIIDNYYVLVINNHYIHQYHNIYLDTIYRCFYNDYKNKIRPRTKVRIRKYIETDTSYLEIKRKIRKKYTNKSRILLKNNNKNFMYKYKQVHLNYVLSNNFNRITLVNYDKTERVTIDMNIKFHNTGNKKDYSLNDTVIIEIKYISNVNSMIRDILDKLHIPSKKFSKYYIGLKETEY